MSAYIWHRYTVSESMKRISVQNENPWVAVGDFLDDWRRSAREQRAVLVVAPLEEVIAPALQQWAAFFAATVEHLCTLDQLPVPIWVTDERYILPESWYLEAKSSSLRIYQEKTTPTAFKKRNIFGGDRMLDRV